MEAVWKAGHKGERVGEAKNPGPEASRELLVDFDGEDDDLLEDSDREDYDLRPTEWDGVDTSAYYRMEVRAGDDDVRSHQRETS